MENWQGKIDGYRDLDQSEIDFMNEVKSHGLQLETLADKLMNDPHADKRWVAIGKTHLQQGLMALMRAIAKPDFF